MTEAVVDPISVYALTGTTTGPFETSWGYEAAAEVQVWIVTVAGVQTLLEAVTDYTLTPGAVTLDDGGSVTLAVGTVPVGGWTSGDQVALIRDTPVSQPEPLGDRAAITPSTVEATINRVVRQAQDSRRDLNRGVAVPLGEAGLTLASAAERRQGLVAYDAAANFKVVPSAPGKFAGWDADGEPVSLAGTGADAGLREDLATGAGALLVKALAAGGVARSVAARLADLPPTPDDYADPNASVLAAGGSLYLPENNDLVVASQPRGAVNGPGALVIGDAVEGERYENLVSPTLEALLSTLGRIGDTSALSLAIARGNVTWVWWGDSITEGVSQTTRRNSFAGIIERQLKRMFPQVTWDFIDLSIAGQDIANANSDTFLYPADYNPTPGWQRVPPEPSLWNLPGGPVVDGAWHAQVEAAAPDVLAMALTENNTGADGYAVAFTFRNILVNRIPYWATVPSVVLITPLTPSRLVDTPFDGDVVAPLINRNASYIRDLAEEFNHTLVDLNRLWIAVSTGNDVVMTRDRRRAGFADYDGAVPWLYTGTRPVVVGSIMTTTAAGFAYRDVLEKDVRISGTLAGAGAPALVYRSNPSTPAQAYRVQVEAGIPQVVLAYNDITIASAAIASAASYVVSVEAVGSVHDVTVNGVFAFRKYDYQRVEAGRYGAGGSGAGTVTNFVCDAAVPTSVGPATLLERNLLGKVDSDWGVNPNSVGGNGINHPTPLGHQLYVAAFRKLIDYITGLVLRPVEQEWTAVGLADAGALAANDYLDIKVNGTVITPQVTGVGNETATHLQGTVPEFSIDIFDDTALVELVNSATATVLATCTINFGVVGAYRVYAAGQASVAAWGFRANVRARARPKRGGDA